MNPFYDALMDIGSIKSVISRHEAAAAYSAASFSRHTGNVSVVLASTGPGTTNLLTGVASAMRERSPMIVLTGQVYSKYMGQGAAQEASPWALDIVDCFKPITKKSLIIGNPENVVDYLAKAYRIATTFPFGPVHLSIPMDVQLGEVDYTPKEERRGTTLSCPDLSQLEMLLSSGPGVIFCGSGVKKSFATKQLCILAENIGWDVVTTPAGKGSIHETHPLSAGVYGLAGNNSARVALESTKRLLILGSSLGELATSNWDQDLLRDKVVFQVDSDPLSFGASYPIGNRVIGDIKLVLQSLNDSVKGKEYFPTKKVEDLPVGEMPSHLSILAGMLDRSTIFCSDIGEHMTWAIKYWKVAEGGSFDITINYGGMGSGIANAIGAQMANPERTVVCWTGEGCFFMHGSEVMTAAQYGLPIIFVVVNNSSYGMVKWGHQLQYGRSPEDFSYPQIDIAIMASAMGIESFKVRKIEDWSAIMGLRRSSSPIIIEIIDQGDAVPPMADRVNVLMGNPRPGPPMVETGGDV